MSGMITGVQLTKRGFLVTLTLFFTFFIWYFVFAPLALQHVVGSIDGIYPIVYGAFNFVIGISLILSGFFIHQFNKIRLIYRCSITISIVTIVLLFVSNIILKLAMIFIGGIFFGIGQLVFLTFFWSLTVPEERGRISGIAGFSILPFFHIIWLTAENLDFFGIIFLGLILNLGMLGIRLLRPEQKILLTRKREEKGYIPEKKTVLFYAIPWIIFSLINATLASNISLNVFLRLPSYLYVILLVLQMIASGVGALGGGIIADLFGRKLSLIFSLTLYGISSALGGFVEDYAVFYFIYVVNGLNWGILWVLYGSVVWGDLANQESYAKRYALGLTVFHLSMGTGNLLSFQISQISILVSALMSCVFIFLSNIPLILAPELLTSDFQEKIKLKVHINVIKKIRKKQSKDYG